MSRIDEIVVRAEAGYREINLHYAVQDVLILLDELVELRKQAKFNQKVLRHAQAEAWEEGHEDGEVNTMNEAMIERGNRNRITNPYREIK